MLHIHTIIILLESYSHREGRCVKLTRDFFRGTSGDGWVAAALVLRGRVSIWTEVPVPTVIRLSVVLCIEEDRRMEGDRGRRGERERERERKRVVSVNL